MVPFKPTVGLIFFILLTMSLFAQENTIKKSGDIVNKKGRSFYKHQVKQNQPLDALSRAYEIPERIIAKFNEDVFVGRNIAGKSILIPVYFPTQEFFTHQMKRGQTLYYVSKKYDIALEKIFEHNPQAREETSRGDKIKIPVEIKREKKAQPKDSSYVYVVKSDNESLYYIAKKFGIRIEALIDANEGVMWYPEPGDSIRIPGKPKEIIEKEQKEEEEKGFCEDYTYDGKTFRIALLFPFHTESNYQDDTLRSANKPIQLSGSTANFFEYYQGILIALDSMRRQGISISLYVYDTQNSETRVKQIMRKPEMEDVDMIVGPAYSKPFAVAAKIAKKRKTPIVSPLSSKREALENNAYVIKIKPHESSYLKKISQYLAKYWNENFVVLHDDSFRERERLKILRDELVDAFTGNRRINDVVYKEINLNDTKLESIERSLSVGMNNIVIIPSTHEPFVTDVISKLHLLYEKYNIWVVGMPAWADFRGINLEYFHELQAHYCDFLYLDFDKAQVKRISRHFKRVYDYAPTSITIEGFEVSYMLFNQMVKYGDDFFRCLDKTELTYPHSAKFNFKQYDNYGGMENTGGAIIRYTPDFHKKILESEQSRDYFRHRPDSLRNRDPIFEQERERRGQ